VKKTLTRLLVLLVIVAAIVAWRASGAAARAEAAAQPLFVPVIATPSIQPVNGQVLLFKATNITEAPVNLSLMLFDDHGGPPKATRDFPQIPAGSTVSYVHEPQKGELTLGQTTVEAPEPVRGIFAPIPGDREPGALRRIVANVQIMRVQPATSSTGSASLDPPILVPLERCRFEPRGFVPYTGGRWIWNCAPEMSPFINPVGFPN
jgi:hypothetical protein